MIKEKTQRKSAIMIRQEEELAQRDSALAAAAIQRSASQQNTQHLTRENAVLKVRLRVILSIQSVKSVKKFEK